MQPKKLENYVTIVTGASSGMGAAIARRFAKEGSKVVLSARRTEKLQLIANQIKAEGAETLVIPADVADYDQVKKLVDQTIETFGRVDVMVNNAGFGLLKSFEDTTKEEIDSQIDVNVKGVCYGCQAVLGIMKKQSHGIIINIGSIASVRHFASFAVYTAAKHAVLGFSKSLYEEVRESGIKVNVLCPAAVNTEFIDVAGFEEVPWKPEEMIQAEDIAELAFTCVTMPKNVQIESMIIWPSAQAT
jgi:NADP-dependent 3-hydroxy acid dehydrogenase YdfG